MPGKCFRVCCLLAVAALAVHAAALEVPRLRGRINDLVGLLTAEQIAALDSKLAELEKSDSTQVAVLIIPSLEGEVLEDYSERVASSWRLGVQGRDNGALLLIAMKERKVRIEVGYGLEPTLTDALCRRIIENEIIPSFRQGRFYEGIDRGISAVIRGVRGVYRPSDRGRTPENGSGGGPLDWLLFLLVPLLLMLSVAGRWGGALFGAAGGLYLASSLFGGSLAALAAGALVGGLLGFVLGAILRAGARSSTIGRRGTWPGTFYYGGRSGSFGGGFGGGFSGGGGRFGGGGASGGW